MKPAVILRRAVGNVLWLAGGIALLWLGLTSDGEPSRQILTTLLVIALGIVLWLPNSSDDQEGNV